MGLPAILSHISCGCSPAVPHWPRQIGRWAPIWGPWSFPQLCHVSFRSGQRCKLSTSTSSLCTTGKNCSPCMPQLCPLSLSAATDLKPLGQRCSQCTSGCCRNSTPSTFWWSQVRHLNAGLTACPPARVLPPDLGWSLPSFSAPRLAVVQCVAIVFNSYLSWKTNQL